MSSVPRILVSGLTGTALGSIVEVHASEVQRVVRVLRLREGDRVVVFDGLGMEAAGELQALTSNRRSDRCSVRLTGTARRGVTFDRSNVILLQCVAKGERFDAVVRHATELGVHSIWPVESLRTIARRSERSDTALARWRSIAAGAAAQSGRSDIPEIRPIATLEAALATLPATHSLRVVPYEGGGRSLVEVVTSDASAYGAAVLVGPEGGFEPLEIAAAERSCFVRVTLGPRILRTETVALAVLAMLAVTLGDLSPRG